MSKTDKAIIILMTSLLCLICFCEYMFLNNLQNVLEAQNERITRLEKAHTQQTEFVKPKTYSDFTIPEWIKHCASIRSLDPNLINAIIVKESNFNASAVSETNDYGLMQIHNTYWEYYFEMDTETIQKYNLNDDPFDPYANILAGCNALAYWRERCVEYGDTSETAFINCYNRGFNYFIDGNTTYSDAVYAILEESQCQ